jgi:hypothetical protein
VSSGNCKSGIETFWRPQTDKVLYLLFWYLPSSPLVDHSAPMVENPDASLFVYGVGNDACAVHVYNDLVGFVDSDGLLSAATHCKKY